jgi:hypothetical protein
MPQAPITDEAVSKATGKTWAEWYGALDRLKAHQLPHKQLAALIDQQFGVGAWWSQMVTVQYERHKGLRVVNQKADGFEVSVSRVLPVPVDVAFAAISSPKWLRPALKPRTSNPNKSWRADGPGGVGVVAVNFYPKNTNKTQISLQHSKLADAAQVEHYRAFWKAALEKLSPAKA